MMLKNILIILSIAFSSIWFSLSPSVIQSQGIKKAIYFYSENCPRCDEAEKYLNDHQLFERYEISKVNISGPYNLGYLNEFFNALGIKEEKRGWPVVFFGDQMLIGSQPIIDDFERDMEKYGTEELPTPEKTGKKDIPVQDQALIRSGNIVLSWPVVLGAALVDSINPCMMGVAMVILFANLGMKNKKESLISNLFFVSGILAIYLLFGIYAYINNVSEIPKRLPLFSGLMIITLGAWGLKNIFSIGRFFRLPIDVKKLYEQEKLFVSFVPVRIWMLFAGMASFLLLLPSTVNPYLGIIGLFPHQPTIMKNIFYLISYNLIFILPISFLAWFFSGEKFKLIKSKKPVLIRIIGSVIMIFLGFYLIFVRV